MFVFMAQNVGMINKNGVSKEKHHTSRGTYFSLWLVAENIDNRKQFPEARSPELNFSLLLQMYYIVKSMF